MATTTQHPNIPELFVFAFASVTFATSSSFAVNIAAAKFAPPRIYFTHSSINQKGVSSAIKGQENFLELYITAIDDKRGQYDLDGFSYQLLVPDFVKPVDISHRFPRDGKPVPKEDLEFTVTKIEKHGRAYKKIEKALGARWLNGLLAMYAGGTPDILWYRIDPHSRIDPDPLPLEVSLFYKGEKCFTDTSVLNVYNELPTPPRVSPKHFKLWLYRGPRWRDGAWDKLAEYLGKAGINTVEFGIGPPSEIHDPAQEECMKEMRKRGFFIIVHRGGGYSFNNGPRSIYTQVQRGLGRYDHDPLSQGPQWFQGADDGAMQHYLPLADAALWNFEPNARIRLVAIDQWNTNQFKQANGMPLDEEINLVVDLRTLHKTENWVTTQAVDSEMLRKWMARRQEKIALVIKQWADFARIINPEVETLITEGNMRVDYYSGRHPGYERFGDHVTYCQPMQFQGPTALRTMEQYMRIAPNARFMGCQAVSAGSYSPVLLPARDISLQTLGAVLIGCKGTSLYAGLSMDAENFVHLNRVMGFLGRNQEVIFEGRSEPANLTLKGQPEGDPSWALDLTSRSYQKLEQDEYLAVALNYNRNRICYLKLAISLNKGRWFLVDDENKEVFVSNGNVNISADTLGKGVILKCPPYDYRGFRLVPASTGQNEVAAYLPVELDTIRKEAFSPEASE